MFRYGNFLILLAGSSAVIGQNFSDTPDADLFITELIEKYGYPAETHDVTTEDGYVLSMYRIPHGKSGSGVNRKPILMMHGLFGQAENFLYASYSGGSLAHYLADHDYDVFLGNARGNQHSRKHVKLDPEKTKFWDFSWHEIGMYDLPAMIDYILKLTGKKQLFYIGHSQGGTVYYVMSSMRPEYQKKIAQVSLLAPGGYENHFTNPLVLPLVKRQKMLTRMAVNAKLVEVPPPWLNLTELLHGTCVGTIFSEFCLMSFNAFGGGDSGESDPLEILELAMRHISSVAARQLIHFAQVIDSGRFRQWDYGKKKNMQVYGSPEPPDYPVQNIEVPCAMYYSLGDNLAVWQDIENICDAMKQCTRKYLMKNPKWSHLDFMISRNLVKELNGPLVEYMDKYANDL